MESEQNISGPVEGDVINESPPAEEGDQGDSPQSPAPDSAPAEQESDEGDGEEAE